MPSPTRVIAAVSVIGLLGLPLPLGATAVPPKEQVDPAAYPELAPEALLPAILAEFRHYIPDVYSVREMKICPAIKIKLKDGKPNDWAVRIEFNAKNENGGYTGIRRDVAVFRNGRIAFPVGNAPQLGRTGLDSVFSKIEDKQMANCPAIPDTVIQQALSAAR